MNRKRPAPGTSPMVQQPNAPQSNYQYQQQPLDNTNDFSNFDFSNAFPTDQNYSDPANFDPNAFSYSLNTQQPQTFGGNNFAPTPSTELVRRSRNQQVLPQGQAQGQASGQRQDAWGGGGYAGNMNGSVEDEDEQDLDARVALAKKDAQGKRKQIPPFVQKLSSFLDSGNTDLIRWSDDGRSFIVLDEDEFARTLIPELFKHNNYASFVRQLNMYGFHKTVNITDGSLRQSEKARKGVKPPSMYSHPYFRRARPDLLWLIQKPSGKSGSKRKRDGTIKDQYDSDEERGFSPAPEGRPHELSAPGGTQDVAQLPRNEMQAVRQELTKLQTQQKFISQMITQLKQQNDEFYRQATAFQALHDRHENSINAILTFLATFYNRSVEGQGANLVNMFATAAQNQQQQHGSVVEEYNDSTPTPSNQVQRYQKRPQLLLPAAPDNGRDQQGRISTAPNSARASASPPNGSSKRESASSAPPDSAQPQSASTPIKTDAQTPNLLPQVPESANQNQMIDLINSANATAAENASGTAAPHLNISDMVDQLGGRVPGGGSQQPFTAQQRDNLLSSIGQQQPNTALASRSGSQGNFDPTALQQSQDRLNSLQSLQREQEAQIQNLQSKLTPMSPTGSIPGLAGGYGDSQNVDPFDSIGAPGDYDPNSFLNFDDGNDFDFGFDTSNPSANAWGDGGGGGGGLDGGAGGDELGDGAGNDMFASGDVDGGGDGSLTVPQEHGEGASRVESVSSSATSPTGGDEPGTPRKRVKR